MTLLPLRLEVSSTTISSLCFLFGILASKTKTPVSVTLVRLKMHLITSIPNDPYKTLNLSGFTVLGAIDWNCTSFTVGLLAGADN